MDRVRVVHRVARILLAGVVAVVVVVAVGIAGLVGPYVRDDWRLDGVVRAVALDWRDFGLDKARTRLQYELDHQGIGVQVGDDSCALEQDPDQRVVRCRWAVDVDIPGLDLALPLSFESRAAIMADGDLR